VLHWKIENTIRYQRSEGISLGEKMGYKTWLVANFFL